MNKHFSFFLFATLAMFTVVPSRVEAKVSVKTSEIACTSREDCERQIAAQKDACPSTQRFTVTGFVKEGKEEVATATCMPLETPAAQPVADTSHEPLLRVVQTPALLTRDPVWILSSPHGCATHAPLVRTVGSHGGWTLAEVFCLSQDNQLIGNEIIDAKGLRRPAKHEKLGCLLINTSDGREVSQWASDNTGAVVNRSVGIAFNAEVRPTTCPASKTSARKGVVRAKRSVHPGPSIKHKRGKR